MKKMKMLGAAAILSAAVAAPVFAQDAGVRGPGSRYGLAAQHRGAYNQVNRPLRAAPPTRDGWNLENSGSSRGDPWRAGREDPSFNPSSS
jgi:hypothetical protein